MELKKLKEDIALYENEVKSLEAIKNCSEVGPFAIVYIDRNINAIKKHIFELQTKIDQLEKDQ